MYTVIWVFRILLENEPDWSTVGEFNDKVECEKYRTNIVRVIKRESKMVESRSCNWVRKDKV
mgnify:FL=1